MSAVALPPLVVLGVILVFGTHALTRIDPARLASAAAVAKTLRLGRWRVPLGLASMVVVLILTGLPVWSMIWHAGRVGGIARMGQSPAWSVSGLLGTLQRAWEDAAEPLVTSVMFAATGALLATLLGWSLAWASRNSSRWQWVTVFAVALALATPGPVAGLALVFGYGSTPLYDTFAMIAFADACRTFPFAVLILWPAVRLIPLEHFEAAEVDGLGPFGKVWRVALPMTRGATIAAWGVCFALALGELSVNYLLSVPGLTPLSVVIWGMLHTGVESRLAGIVLIMLTTMVLAGGFAAFMLSRIAEPES